MADDDQNAINPGQAHDIPQIPSPQPQDGNNPAAPADDVDNDVVLGDAHQATDYDSDIDEDEAYQEGTPAAADAAEPSDPGVGGYTPPAEQDAE